MQLKLKVSKKLFLINNNFFGKKRKLWSWLYQVNFSFTSVLTCENASVTSNNDHSLENSSLVNKYELFELILQKTLGKIWSITEDSRKEIKSVQKQSPGGVLQNRCSKGFHKIHKSISVFESLFNKVSRLFLYNISRQLLLSVARM